MTRVLVLGGAAETPGAVAGLRNAGFAPVVHWARRNDAPDLPTCDSLRAGLDGAVALVDVTHAFDTDTRMIAHRLTPTLPFLRLARAPWQATRGDRWTQVPDLPRAVAATPRGARVFAATGRDSAEVLAHHDGPVFLRQLRPHKRAAPPNCTFVFGDGPFAVAEEVNIFRELRIDLVMARNIGGAGSFPKIEAARAMGLPVILLTEPPVPQGAVFRTLPALIDRLRVRVG
ncbi:MAG: precorrin-6A/cobalt-precorrin-6A reductase [Pseudomonadota bacterium]